MTDAECRNRCLGIGASVLLSHSSLCLSHSFLLAPCRQAMITFVALHASCVLPRRPEQAVRSMRHTLLTASAGYFQTRNLEPRITRNIRKDLNYSCTDFVPFVYFVVKCLLPSVVFVVSSWLALCACSTSSGQAFFSARLRATLRTLRFKLQAVPLAIRHGSLECIPCSVPSEKTLAHFCNISLPFSLN